MNSQQSQKKLGFCSKSGASSKVLSAYTYWQIEPATRNIIKEGVVPLATQQRVHDAQVLI
jgi:hypothetical protein